MEVSSQKYTEVRGNKFLHLNIHKYFFTVLKYHVFIFNVKLITYLTLLEEDFNFKAITQFFLNTSFNLCKFAGHMHDEHYIVF